MSVSGVSALNAAGKYDLTIPGGSAANAQARIDADASFLNIAGQSIEQAHGTVTKSGDKFGFDLRLASNQLRQTTCKAPCSWIPSGGTRRFRN